MIRCTTKVDPDPDPQLRNFSELFTGKFSSTKQAEKDASYSSVILINTPIWKDRSGYWLYHELHDEENSTFIYNQRIINIRRLDSTVIRTISYIIPNKKKYINAWKDTSIFNNLNVDSLTIRDGCDVYFKKMTSTIYQGKTKKGNCLSSFSKKIAYTTSDIVISNDQISSWDRGYCSNKKQVWGKIQGPYKFIRVKNKKN